MSKQWDVRVPVDGYYIVSVLADSQEDAEDEACNVLSFNLGRETVYVGEGLLEIGANLKGKFVTEYIGEISDDRAGDQETNVEERNS